MFTRRWDGRLARSTLQVLNAFFAGWRCIFCSVWWRNIAIYPRSHHSDRLVRLCRNMVALQHRCRRLYPRILLLILCADLLIAFRPPRPVLVALLHILAMLVHELAFLFVVPASYWIWHHGAEGESQLVRFRRTLVYACTAGFSTLGIYIAVFRWRFGDFTSPAFFAFLTSHATGPAFPSASGRNSWLTLRSWTQVFLAGKMSLVRYSGWRTYFLIALR